MGKILQKSLEVETVSSTNRIERTQICCSQRIGDHTTSAPMYQQAFDVGKLCVCLEEPIRDEEWPTRPVVTDEERRSRRDEK